MIIGNTKTGYLINYYILTRAMIETLHAGKIKEKILEPQTIVPNPILSYMNCFLHFTITQKIFCRKFTDILTISQTEINLNPKY